MSTKDPAQGKKAFTLEMTPMEKTERVSLLYRLLTKEIEAQTSLILETENKKEKQDMLSYVLTLKAAIKTCWDAQTDAKEAVKALKAKMSQAEWDVVLKSHADEKAKAESYTLVNLKKRGKKGVTDTEDKGTQV